MNRINKNLKPCPFCGNPAEIVNATYEERPEWCKGMEWYKIRCVNECCLFLHQGQIFGSKEEAANEWNLRRKANPNFFPERRKKSIIVKTRESEDKEDDQIH